MEANEKMEQNLAAVDSNIDRSIEISDSALRKQFLLKRMAHNRLGT
jgi:hypothetical protein